jgi:hypothetical protein
VYNLLTQAVEENKSLWRMKNHYIKDVGDCEECKQYWNKLIERKEQESEELWNLIHSHLDSDKK